MFSKKRTIEEITVREPVITEADVDMEEEIAKPDDSMATENFKSAIDDSKVLEQSPAKAAEPMIEDDWQKLKIQNHLMNTADSKMEV